jgi:hypothetical protein
MDVIVNTSTLAWMYTKTRCNKRMEGVGVEMKASKLEPALQRMDPTIRFLGQR